MLSNLTVGKVLNERASEGARRNDWSGLIEAESPRSVLSLISSLSIWLDLSSNDSESSLLRGVVILGVLTVASTEDIVDVHAVGKVTKLLGQLITLGIGITKVSKSALLLHDFIIEGLLDETVTISHVNEGRGSVIVPVGDTVANHHTLKVGSEDIRISNVDLVVVMDLVHKVRNINSTI